MGRKRMLVIVAHVGDFIWRCGGAIAKYIKAGHEVYVIALTYGARGESNLYWQLPNANMEECLETRRKEGEKAAEILGVTSIEFWEYEDYPLFMDKERVERLAKRIYEIRPNFILTHDKEDDTFNMDHNLVSRSVLKACNIEVEVSFDGRPINQPKIPVFGIEPHNPEICKFQPNIYIDISEVMDLKKQAMETAVSQKNMAAHYITKAKVRGAQASARGKTNCRYAEAFTVYNPISDYGRFIW